MGVKANIFKQNEVRTRISFLKDNQEVIITVKNALGEDREKLLKIWEEKSKIGTKEAQHELTQAIITNLTDIEVDNIEELVEAINNPTAEMSLVLHETNEIMHEIMVQYWTGKVREINQSSIHLLTTIALQKTQEMSRLVKDLEDAKKPIDLETIENDIKELQGIN